MEQLAKFLQDEHGSRVTLGHRWLVWDRPRWVVHERLPYQQITRVVVSTKDLELAIKSMVLSELREDE